MRGSYSELVRFELVCSAVVAAAFEQIPDEAYDCPYNDHPPLDTSQPADDEHRDPDDRNRRVLIASTRTDHCQHGAKYGKTVEGQVTPRQFP